MSCNNKHDFPFATTDVGEVKDSFMASVGFENGKYLKLGNVLTVAQIGGHAYHGEWENVAQDVGVWAATTAIALAIANSLSPLFEPIKSSMFFLLPKMAPATGILYPLTLLKRIGFE